MVIALSRLGGLHHRYEWTARRSVGPGTAVPRSRVLQRLSASTYQERAKTLTPFTPRSIGLDTRAGSAPISVAPSADPAGVGARNSADGPMANDKMFPTALTAIGTIMPDYIGADSIPGLL